MARGDVGAVGELDLDVVIGLCLVRWCRCLKEMVGATTVKYCCGIDDRRRGAISGR